MTTPVPETAASGLIDKAVEDALNAYKLRVRDEALRVKRETGWCDSGVNETLSRLDLDQLPTPKSFVFRVPTTGFIEYNVTSYTPDEAATMVAKYVEKDRARFAQGGTARSDYGHTRQVRVADGDAVPYLAPQPTTMTVDDDGEDDDNY